MSNANHFKMKPQLDVKLELRAAFNARVQITLVEMFILKKVVYIPIGIATCNIGPSTMKLKPDKYGVLYSTMSFLL